MRAYFNIFYALIISVFLVGCANQSMPGYQKVYQGYEMPQNLVDAVQKRMYLEGLKNAVVTRDTVGRLRLAGQYKDEDEVDKAFIIAQSLVGIKSTSPFYPENVLEKRWNKDAENAMSDYFKKKKQAKLNAPGTKYALVIGVNKFIDSEHLNEIQGEDDARFMGFVLNSYGFNVMSVLGERATKYNIEAAIRELEEKIGSNDSLFIYVSSHGTQPIPTPANGDERKMSIAAYDSGDINPNNKSKDKTSFMLKLQKTSVSDILIQRLAQKPTAATRVIIDTCYSGEILKDLPSEGAAYQAQQNEGGFEKASVSLASWSGEAYTSKGISFVADANASTNANASKNSTVNPAQKSKFEERKNYTFITATSANEIALGPRVSEGTFKSPINQSDLLKGSFFTQSFLAYLKKYAGDVPKAFEEARIFTSQQAEKLSQGKVTQNPRRFSSIPAAVDNLNKY